jgi:hypothetical protein
VPDSGSMLQRDFHLSPLSQRGHGIIILDLLCWAQCFYLYTFS